MTTAHIKRSDRCHNCGCKDDDRLFFYLRDPETKERLGYCSIACYQEGMKNKGIYEHIKAKAIAKYKKFA